MNTNALNKYTNDQITLTLPHPLPFDDTAHSQLTQAVNEIYTFCQNACQPLAGLPLLTFEMNLSQKKVQLLTDNQKFFNSLRVTSYCRDGLCCNLKWEFDLASEKKTYITGRRHDPIEISAFTGLEYERIFPTGRKSDKSFKQLLSKQVWDRWEETLAPEATHYTKILHPQIVATIQKINALNPV